MAVLRVRGKFASDGARKPILIPTRYSQKTGGILNAMGSSCSDFIRDAVDEKLARSGALCEDAADRV